ncbi:hypothetical protein [Methanocaldococcus sp.]
MGNKKDGEWIAKLLEEINKPNINGTELILDEVLTKLNNLICDINSYINEIHYGLKVTNEKIDLSMSEVNTISKKLEYYLSMLDELRTSLENTKEEMIMIKNEFQDLKKSVNDNKSYYKTLENNLKVTNKKIDTLNVSIKNLAKNNDLLFKEIKKLRLLVYATLALSIFNLFLSLKTF